MCLPRTYVLVAFHIRMRGLTRAVVSRHTIVRVSLHVLLCWIIDLLDGLLAVLLPVFPIFLRREPCLLFEEGTKAGSTWEVQFF